MQFGPLSMQFDAEVYAEVYAEVMQRLRRGYAFMQWLCILCSRYAFYAVEVHPRQTTLTIASQKTFVEPSELGWHVVGLVLAWVC